MSDENIPNQTQAADPIIASTPEPNTESWESQISRQLNKKPDIKKIDIKSLEDLPDGMTPTDLDYVSEQDSNDYLKQMDGGTTERTEKKTKKVKEEPADPVDSLDLSDLDLSKDPEPIEEKPKKKSKEDNIAELRKKAEAYEESLKAKDTEVLTYREKLEKLEGELERTAFERSPKFKDLYQQPYSDALTEATEFAKEYADDEAIAEKALSLKGKERIEFIDDSFGGAAGAQFLSLINQADSKRNALEVALQNHRETHQEIILAEQQQVAQTSEEINKRFDRVAQHLASKSDYFKMTGDDEVDNAVKTRLDAARNIVSGNVSHNELMLAPFLAVIAKETVEENAKLKAEIAKYKSRIKEDIAVQPRISKGSSDDDDGEVRGKPKSALDSIRSQLRSY